MTVRINKQKINLREKLTEFEDKVNFDEVVRGLGVYPSDGNVGIGTTNPSAQLHVQSEGGSTTEPNVVAVFQANTTDAITTGGGSAIKFRGKSAGGNYSNWDQSMIASYGASGNNAHGIGFYGRVNASTPLQLQMLLAPGGNVALGAVDPGANRLYVNGNIYASGTITPSSDDRVKHNEQNIVGAIETLGKITPKKYIKTTEMYEANHDFELDADGNPVDADGEPVEHSIEAGVIAQQVLEVPELAFMVSPEGVDEDGNVTSPHGLNYNSLFTYAIAAIQEQQSIIEDLKSRIETLESK